MKQIKGLDTIRAFAIIFVVLAHWGLPFDEKTPIGNFLKTKVIPDGAFGVDLFFVLSGFLITTILLQAKADMRADNKLESVKSFFARRVLRIFPIYYLTIFFLLLINYRGVRDGAAYYLTFTSNILIYKTGDWAFIPHTWSLAVEEQFYLIWPWLIFYIDWEYLKYLFIVAIAVSIGSSLYMNEVLHKGGFPILVYNCLVCFGLGGWYAFARFNNVSYTRLKKRLLPAFVVSLALYFRWKFINDAFSGHSAFLFRTVEGIISLQIIAAVVNNKSEWVRKHLLENKALNYIGQVSYGIYLYHNILQPVWDGYVNRARLRHPDTPEFLYGYYGTYLEKIILIFIMSWASYKLIEQPALRLKKWFPYKSKDSYLSKTS